MRVVEGSKGKIEAVEGKLSQEGSTFVQERAN